MSDVRTHEWDQEQEHAILDLGEPQNLVDTITEGTRSIPGNVEESAGAYNAEQQRLLNEAKLQLMHEHYLDMQNAAQKASSYIKVRTVMLPLAQGAPQAPVIRPLDGRTRVLITLISGKCILTTEPGGSYIAAAQGNWLIMDATIGITMQREIFTRKEIYISPVSDTVLDILEEFN